jgi:hypothetical protein
MENTELTSVQKDELILAQQARLVQLEYQLSFALNALKQIESEDPEVFVSQGYQSLQESYRLLWN